MSKEVSVNQGEDQQVAKESSNEFEEFITEVATSKRPELDEKAEPEADIMSQPQAEPQQDEEPEQASTEPEDEPAEPKPQLYTLPDDPAYGEFRGKKLTAAQLEEHGLLTKQFNREHNDFHHSKLYKEMKEKFEALEAKFSEREQVEQQRAVAAQQGPPMSPEETAKALERHYVPQLSQMAESGAFEEDFLTVYPRVAAQLEHRFQTGGLAMYGTIRQVTELTNQLSRVMEYVGMQQQQAGAQQQRSTMESKMDEVSKEMPALGAQDVRERFIDWAIDENNQITGRFAEKDISDISKEEVKAAFAAYVAMTGDGIKARPKPSPESQLAGAGGSARSGHPASNPPMSEIERFTQEFAQTVRR